MQTWFGIPQGGYVGQVVTEKIVSVATIQIWWVLGSLRLKFGRNRQVFALQRLVTVQVPLGSLLIVTLERWPPYRGDRFYRFNPISKMHIFKILLKPILNDSPYKILIQNFFKNYCRDRKTCSLTHKTKKNGC